jgi:lysophospholipase L1-like esterase
MRERPTIGFVSAREGLGANRWLQGGFQPVTRLTRLASAATVAALIFSSSSAWAGDMPLPNVAHRIARGLSLRIVAFGSSSTEGVGATSPQAAYPAVLERDLDTALARRSVVVLNRGVGGQDADDMMIRIDQDALSLRPDLVIWQTGSNDSLRGVPLDRFKAETTAALLKLRNAGIDVMLLEPQWCAVFDRNPISVAYRDTVREVGQELDVPVIRRSSLMKTWLREGLVTYNQLLSRDGLHMTDGGYALLAKDIAFEILTDAGLPPKQIPRTLVNAPAPSPVTLAKTATPAS